MVVIKGGILVTIVGAGLGAMTGEEAATITECETIVMIEVMLKRVTESPRRSAFVNGETCACGGGVQGARPIDT